MVPLLLQALFFLLVVYYVFLALLDRTEAEKKNQNRLSKTGTVPSHYLPAEEVPGDQLFATLHQTYGDLYKISFLGECYTVLTGSKGVDFFKQNERKYFQVKGSSPASWDELYGTDNPILSASEGTHRLFRKATTNDMMSLKASERFFPTLLKVIKQYMQIWAGQDKVPSDDLSLIAFSISWVWVFGDRGQQAVDMYDLFSYFVRALSAPASDDPESTYGLGMQARAKIVAHLEEIYANPPTDAIPNLFSTFAKFYESSDNRSKKLSDLLVGVLFAAYHAISVALNGAFWEIGKNLDLQDRLRKEYLAALRESGQELSLSQLNALPLLNSFVNETLRLYNAGVGIYRLTTDRFVYNNYEVPKDTKVFIFCAYDHYKVDNPTTFQENRNNESYRWQPFGVGARSCMGQKFAIMEMKAVITQIVGTFFVSFSEEVQPKRFPEFEIDDYICLIKQLN